MDDNTYPASEAELDQFLSDAANDLDRVWRSRMMARFITDAKNRGDERTVTALEPLLDRSDR
ncbi:hypothetical protein [Nocardiopsis dassonvillei]|uniref:hypothetical protein n=1 Tax=Nocardiopsis dassonvillei TaxID=2014 RepID=UPI00366B8FF8